MYYNKNTNIFLEEKWLKAKEANTDLYAQTLHYGTGAFEGIRHVIINQKKKKKKWVKNKIILTNLFKQERKLCFFLVSQIL